MLLDSILDFSRIESGRKSYDLEECDLGQIARQAWALFEPRFAADGFETVIQIAPHVPPVRGDAQALGQVVMNLLQNAYRYAGEGKYVRLAVAREGLVAVLTVEDHGIGMTQPQLEQLGNSFYRAADTRVRRTRGTGLGLTIVNHIVTAHHGKLEVQSKPGKGSTFTVWLPLEATAVEGSLERT
jgi:two-component system phosphate regulon sensor histidine kinase PhoR